MTLAPVPVHVWNECAPVDDDVRVQGWLDAASLCNDDRESA